MRHGIVAFQEYFLILDCPPQPLTVNVVQGTPLAVHAYLYPGFLKDSDKI